jgi:hypothetical protein
MGAMVAVVSATTRASANGRYPASNQIAFDPADADHIVVAATIGLLESRDGGKTFDWRCESALGKVAALDSRIAVTANGSTVVARFDGVAVTSDGCSFRTVPELAGKSIGDLTLAQVASDAVLAFYMEAGPTGANQAQITRSPDDGQTWAPLGTPLTQGVLLTIDAAPSDASRVYLSASLGADRDFASVLMRSDNAGLDFGATEIPGTAGYRPAWIAGVHPNDPDRIYVRVQDPAGTVILSSIDGGAMFQTMFTGTGELLGFAISPDGANVAFGGPRDGIWVGQSDGANLARVSDVAPTCLGWTERGLYACADQKKDGFSLGVSTDMGAHFDGLLRFDALCGRTACGGATTVATKCPADWPQVAPLVGTTCGIDAGSPANDGGDGSAVDDAATPNDVTSDDGSRGPEPAPGRSPGCSCSLVSASSPNADARMALLLAAIGWTALRSIQSHPSRRRLVADGRSRTKHRGTHLALRATSKGWSPDDECSSLVLVLHEIRCGARAARRLLRSRSRVQHR